MVDNNLTEGALEENAFETCPHMKTLCHNSIKVGVSMSKLFSNFNFLTIIKISYTNLENGGTIVLVNDIKNSAPSLKVIEMAGNNITYEAAPDIAACLEAKRHLKSMEGLDSRYIDTSYNDLRRGGALSLAHVVVKRKGFKMLNIDGNVISVKRH
ncbi:hypothetical protein F2Q70_00037678 [Brassica cretica]|uniref:Uncharacterized protein n=1 Tax=Brassica cretica TaxID=69181 RepID=A0A8S9JWG8_BRACR|nr:hypothetical protein F2Q70_00037678 [Brassica cretica]